MPDLPTFTVTQQVASRIIAAFANETDDAGKVLTPEEGYRHWLRRTLAAEVAGREGRSTRDTIRNGLT